MSSILLHRDYSIDLMSCRACRAHFGEFLTLDSEVHEGRRLLELFNEYTWLQATLSDQVPQMLCQSCVDELHHLEEFVLKAQTADKFLKELLLLKNMANKNAPNQNVALDSHEQQENHCKSQISDSFPDTLGTEEEYLSDINDEKDAMELFSMAVNDKKSSKISEKSSEHDTRSSITLNRYHSHKNNVEVYKENVCEICGERFSCKQKLQQHEVEHEELHSFAYSKRSVVNSYQRATKQFCFTCEYCNKSLSTLQGLDRHRKLHTGSRPYTCEVCNRAFAQRSVLKTHQALHSGKKTKCPQCPKMFSRPSQLIVHRRAHSGERPYKCDHCESAYTQKSHLDRHMGTHLGIRFKCLLCDKSYSKMCTLSSHIKQDHEIIPQEYKFAECSKQFIKKKSYQYHMKSKHKTKRD